MAEILFINACVREHSRTLELARHVLGRLGTESEEIKLYDLDLPPLGLEGMETRARAFDAKDFSDKTFDLARQFARAKTIVVAAPYWDLMFPAVVKSYFEAVTVNGLTFAYGPTGIPRGLCQAEKLIYVTTSGGPIIHNFGYDYVTTLAKSFYGISEVTCVSAQGLDIHGADVSALLCNAKGAFDQGVENNSF